MSAPLTTAQAEARGLLMKKGIHTFSNGEHWDSWACSNCFECKHYDPEEAGACAFESAAFLGLVSPALAILFGWKEDAEFPGSYNPPQSCAFFSQRGEDGDDAPPPAPAPDPLQLVLLADPTEDLAWFPILDVMVNSPTTNIHEITAPIEWSAA